MILRSIIVVLACGCLSVATSGIRILENTTSRLSFEWTTDGLNINQTGQSSVLLFTGKNSELGERHDPLIPAYSFYVGIPKTGNSTVNFQALSTHAVVLTKDIQTRLPADTQTHHKNIRFTNQWLSDAAPITLSGLLCDQFFIRPFLWNPQTKTLQILDKGVFTITFPQATANGRVASSEFNRMLRRLVLNYDVACKWQPSPVLAKRTQVKASPLTTGSAMAMFKIGDGYDNFAEGTINENGVIRISGKDLIRIFGASVSLNQIALYASYKGELPFAASAYNNIPAGLSEVPLMRFAKNAGGLLDTADYALAYVSGTSDWLFDTVGRSYTYNIDRYDDYRTYWLCQKNGAQSVSVMPKINTAPSATITSTTGHVLFTQPASVKRADNIGGDGPSDYVGLDWDWHVFSSSTVQSFTPQNIVLPNIDISGQCFVRLSTASGGGISISNQNGIICTTNTSGQWYAMAPSAGSQSITISAQTAELLNAEFAYSQALDMTGKQTLTVFSPESMAIVQYHLTGLPQEAVYIFRIARNDSSIMLIDSVHGLAAYEWVDTTGTGVRYYLCTKSSILASQALTTPPVTPVGSGDFVMTNLRAWQDRPVDYIIISNPAFLTQAIALATEKKRIGRFANPQVVSISDVYNQFSGGNTDPAAVRNCLEYMQAYGKQQWPLDTNQLAFAVFMGDGHYDYKSILAGKDSSFMPVAYNGSACVENFFVCFDTASSASGQYWNTDMCFGRISCKTAAEAAQVVDKIAHAEDPSLAIVNNWRNRVVLACDDDWQWGEDGIGPDHIQASEAVATLLTANAPDLDIRKVYEYDYPFDAFGHKPDATQALVSAINNGAMLVNFFGHGSSAVWTDELLLAQTNLASMTNKDMYPLVGSFSCSVGKFDEPGASRCLSELLVNLSYAGAIASVACTRSAEPDQNQTLGTNFFQNMFDTSNGYLSFGAAFSQAQKQTADYNQINYSYLGDPSILTMMPKRTIQITVLDENGKSVDTLKALEHITIKGTVSSQDGSLLTDPAFTGTSSASAQVQFYIFNPPYMDNHRQDGINLPVIPYSMQGLPVYSGQFTIKNGVFAQQLMIPKNVTLNTPGVRVVAYAWHGMDVAVGEKPNMVFSGFASGKITDTTGPLIAVRPVYTGTDANDVAGSTQGTLNANGISASLPFTLSISLFDSSGIDAVSTGPDEGLTYAISGVKNLSRQNINQFFTQGSDFRSGTAAISFDNGTWQAGSYTLTLSAEDLVGNVSHKTFTLNIMGDQDLALTQVFNYPNPMRIGASTRFYWDVSRTQASAIRAIIKIYTLSGRLVRVFNNAIRGVEFNGKDDFGKQLSPGIYLYQVIVTDNQKMVKSAIEKIAINPP